MDVADPGTMTNSSAKRRASEATGTPGTKTRDSRVARYRGIALVLGLAIAACGGESSTSDDTSGSGGTSNGPTNGTTGNSTTGNSTTGNSTTGNATTGGCSDGGDPIPPGCFGSPGPVTSGASTTGGAGGSANTSDTTGANTGGSGGSAGAGGAACEPQDVGGVGNCDAAFGVFFLGSQCGWVSGCSCEGEDCDNRYEDEASCEAAHRECFDDCAPQDVSFVGDCEPASRYAFNGIECVAMDGCSCIGDDCDASYDSLEACEAAHATCSTNALSCDEIEALSDAYVSHTACQDDSDCLMVYGQCGIGVGGCYHVVNREWDSAGLEAIGAAWANAGCTGPVCDCAEPPDTVICDDGVCAFAQ